ncbi:MAG: glycosyltransferase family 4 protein [Anaerolineae bacterium]
MDITIPLARTSISGGTRIALQYADELAALGHRVMLLAPQDTDLDYFGISKQVQLLKVRVPRAARLLAGGLADLVGMAQAIPKCDLIFCNSWQMVFPALLSGKQHQGAQIVHLVQHQDSLIIREKPWFTRWRNSVLADFIYHAPTTKIVVSSWLVDVIKQAANQKAVCVPNGIDIYRFTEHLPPQRSVSQEHIDILVTGRLAKWKGYQDAVEAVRLLARKDKRYRLVVASREPITIPDDYPSILVKPKNDRELGELYLSCSVFVMPSWYEGFGLPALEAMALGAPVVTTACRGIDDFAVHGVNCLIVPPKNPAAIADAVQRIATEPGLSEKLSTSGIRTGEQFTTRRMAAQFIDAVERVRIS